MRVLVFGTGIEFSHVLGLATAGHEVYYYTDYISPYQVLMTLRQATGLRTSKKCIILCLHRQSR